MSIWTKFPRIPARLTDRDRAVLRFGFHLIMCGKAAMSLGCLPHSAYFRVFPEVRLREAEFDPELMARVLRLWRREGVALHASSPRTHRTHLDAFEAGFLAFTARLTARQVRHGHFPVSDLINIRSCSRVAEKLDRLRKKAKSAWLSSEHAELYRPYQQRWRCFSRWLHLHFGCLCNRTWHDSRRRVHRLILAQAMAMCRQIFRQGELLEPEEPIVRKLARLFLREVRRGRINGVGVRDVDHKTPTALNRLEFFLERRLPKLSSTMNTL